MYMPSPFLILALIAVLAAPPLAHAGNVVSKLSGGTLTLTGDDTANDLTIDQVGVPADSLRVTPGAGTTVDGNATPQVFAAATGGLKVVLGTQDDVVLIQGTALAGKLEIKAGAGRDDLVIDTTTIAGAVKVDLGDGPNALTVCTAQLGGKLSVKGGSASPLLPGIEPQCPSVPDLAFALSANIVRVESSIIVGDLAIIGDEGLDASYLNAVDVGGKFKMTGGPGRAFAAMCDVDVKKDVVFDFDVSTSGVVNYQCPLAGGGGTAVQGNGNAVALASVGIGGKLAVSAGAGGVAVCDVTTRKDLVLKFADTGTTTTAQCLLPPMNLLQTTGGLGSPAVLLQVDVGGNLDAKFAATDFSAHRFALAFAIITKAWKMAFAAGGATIDSTMIRADSLSVKGGDGGDDVAISEGTFAKKGSLDLADGANLLTIGTTTFGGDLAVKTGDGNDTIDVVGATVGGKKTIKNGGGTDTVQQ